MVALRDYEGVQGFGLGNQMEVTELNKALSAGYGTDPAGQTGGGALRVESLETSLKVLTYSQQHIVFWKDIPKAPAYNTVEEYNQLTDYGSQKGFSPEGILPEEDTSSFARKASFVKFVGTTRSVTHPMALVRPAHGDVIALENQNAMLFIMRVMERACFMGNSKLGVSGAESVEFDGLDNLIDSANYIDLKNNPMEERVINDGSQLILDNYGTPTHLYMPFKVLGDFSKDFFLKERVMMPTADGYKAGVTINSFVTQGGEVAVRPDIFLQKTPVAPSTATSTLAPTAPATVDTPVFAGTDGEFAKEAANGIGAYIYKVSLANRFGESAAVASGAINVTSTETVAKNHLTLTVTNAGAITVAPEFMRVYRTAANGTIAYHLFDIPVTNVSAGGSNTFVDINRFLPNTSKAYMGEMSNQVINFKQLAPIMKMDLAIMAPAYRWMVLLYGVLQLYAPKKWMRFINIASVE